MLARSAEAASPDLRAPGPRSRGHSPIRGVEVENREPPDDAGSEPRATLPPLRLVFRSRVQTRARVRLWLGSSSSARVMMSRAIGDAVPLPLWPCSTITETA